MPKLYKKNYVTRKNDPTTQAIIEDLKEVHPEQSLERIYLDVAGRKEENRVWDGV